MYTLDQPVGCSGTQATALEPSVISTAPSAGNRRQADAGGASRSPPSAGSPRSSMSSTRSISGGAYEIGTRCALLVRDGIRNVRLGGALHSDQRLALASALWRHHHELGRPFVSVEDDERLPVELDSDQALAARAPRR